MRNKEVNFFLIIGLLFLVIFLCLQRNYRKSILQYKQPLKKLSLTAQANNSNSSYNFLYPPGPGDWQSCVPPLRVTVIGHSRARQVFEALVQLTGASYLKRQQVAPGEFIDQTMPTDDWRHFYAPNSTCLGVWPKPASTNATQSSRIADAWCSHAAKTNNNHIQLEFRWRHSMHSFGTAVGRTVKAASCQVKQLLVLTQGLHVLAVVPGHLAIPLLLRDSLESLSSRLTGVTGSSGCLPHVVWLPETSGNARMAAASLSDDSTVYNALLFEVLARPLVALSFTIWTAALANSANLWTRICTAESARHWSDDVRRICLDETFHVDRQTAQAMAAQLLTSGCNI